MMKLVFARPLCMLVLLVCLSLLADLRFLSAQMPFHIISFGVPESLSQRIEDTILPPFLKIHPEISVSVVSIPDALFQALTPPGSQADGDAYLRATETLVTQADVLLLLPSTLSPEATRAGSFMDLAPLIAQDAQLSVDDFISAAWQSYQWDGGQWALPVSVTPLVVAYDEAAFDAAGLSYPTEQWTLDEFANAARALSTPDRPGFQIYPVDVPVFLRMFLNEGFADDQVPAHPQFDDPHLVALVEQWAALTAKGVVTESPMEHPPLQFTRISTLSDRRLTGNLGFEGQAGLDVVGIGLSSGTTDAEAAYRLAVYLTESIEFQSVLYSSLPARYSVPQDVSQGPPLSTAAQKLSKEALKQALPLSETLFGRYITHALSLIGSDTSAVEALDNAQQEAEVSLAQAEARHETIVVPVQTPVPVAQPDEQVITFGLFTGGTGLPNRVDWERGIEAFVAQDDQIDRIEFNFVPSTEGFWETILENECIYGYPIDHVADDQLLPLEPLIATDPTFDTNDVVGHLMQEMMRNGHTFELPVTISPYVLRYDRQAFQAAGLPEPDGTWTVSEFIDTLEHLQPTIGNQRLQFVLNALTPWEMLMAGYGSPLIDYSTTPATLNIDHADLVPVAEQVLGLGKSGIAHYARMATFFGSGESAREDMPLVADYYVLDGIGQSPDRYGITMFPHGETMTPISYDTINGFIRADALHPEGCYRWLRTLSKHPELYLGMPAYHSVIKSAEIEAVYGQSQVETFKRFADIIGEPEAVFISPRGLGMWENLFVTRALDRYMLEDADLKTELEQAGDLIESYRACLAEGTGTGTEIVNCLLVADPTINELLPPELQTTP